MMFNKIFFFSFFTCHVALAILVEEPAGCLQKQNTCAIKSIQGSLSLKLDGASLHLSDGSILIRKKSDEFVLVQGSLYVESLQKNTIVSSEYIHIQSKKGGFWILKNNQNQTVVRNIDSSDLKIQDRKKQNLPQLMIGFENWYAGISSSGSQMTGILRPIEFSSYMKEHLTIASSDRVKAVQDLKVIKSKWDQSQQNVSDIYEKVATRQVAHEPDELSRHSDSKEIQSPTEKEMLQKLFKKKNFIDPELVESP